MREGWILTAVADTDVADVDTSVAVAATSFVVAVGCRVRTTWLSPLGSKLASFESRSRRVVMLA